MAVTVVSWNIAKRHEPWRQLLQMETDIALVQEATSPAEDVVRLDDANRLMSSFEILEDGPVVTESLIELCREVPIGGSQVYDANIVATMLAHGERRLLTFNVADFRRYGDRIELVGN